MMILANTLNNDKGSVLIFSLLILLLLTIAGVSGLNTTDVEISTARNSFLYKQSFYEAESAATQGARWLKNKANKSGSLAGQTYVGLERSVPSRSNSSELKKELTDFRNPVTWVMPGDENENTVAGALANTNYRIIDYGISNGESLALNNSTGGVKHEYIISGRYSSNSGARRGSVMVEKGFRIRVK